MPHRKVIFVDDEPRILAAIKRRLGDDFNILTFERSLEALDYLKNYDDVSVIIADMRMPEMDGIELLKHCQTLRPKVKRIMLTGNSDQQTAINAINDGKIFRFLRKPCDAEKIKETIELAVEELDFSGNNLEELTSSVKNATPGPNKAQNMFLSVMTDELRTPLSQVIAISKSLAEHDLALNEQTRSHMLHQICEAGQRSLRNIDRILSFVKLECAPSDNKKPIDLIKALKRQADTVMDRAMIHGITISNTMINHPIWIDISENNLRMALSEALSNAIKFNMKDGHIGIQIKASRTHVALRITNSGQSINFTPYAEGRPVFQPGNSQLNRQCDGMGLGFSLINAAARDNFHYTVTPRSGGGTSITFIFNRAQEKPQSRVA